MAGAAALAPMATLASRDPDFDLKAFLAEGDKRAGDQVRTLDVEGCVVEAEARHERGAAHGAEAGEIVEHALADFFRAQVGVVGVGEPVGLVAQALQQLQAGVGERQPQRLAGVGEEDRLLLLRQADQRGRLAVEREERLVRGADLAAAAVDDHEVRERVVPAEAAREHLQSLLPGVYLCTSSELVREWREFERSSTTVLNAFVGPKVESYVARLEAVTAQAGFTGQFYLMQPSGGVMTVVTSTTSTIAAKVFS